MAYSSTITVIRAGDKVVVNIAETDAANSSETDAIETGSKYLQLLAFEIQCTAGAGTKKVDPELGTKAGFVAGDGMVFENALTTATGIYSNGWKPGGGASPSSVPCIYSADGKLYHRSNGNGVAADKVINTQYLFKIGW